MGALTVGKGMDIGERGDRTTRLDILRTGKQQHFLT